MLQKLDDARQTAGDVFCLGCFTWNLRDDVAGFHVLAVAHHQVSTNRHLVSLQHLVARANIQTGLFLFVRRVFNDHARLTGYFVDFFVKRDAFLQVLELNVTSNFRQNRERERIPCSQKLILSYTAPSSTRMWAP